MSFSLQGNFHFFRYDNFAPRLPPVVSCYLETIFTGKCDEKKRQVFVSCCSPSLWNTCFVFLHFWSQQTTIEGRAGGASSIQDPQSPVSVDHLNKTSYYFFFCFSSCSKRSFSFRLSIRIFLFAFCSDAIITFASFAFRTTSLLNSRSSPSSS